MCFLHTFPILHRNLTPRNILIGEKLNAKISDFGLYETKVQTNFYADLRKSCTKESKKRPIYKAPEVIEKNAYSMASDVYTFGKDRERERERERRVCLCFSLVIYNVYILLHRFNNV